MAGFRKAEAKQAALKVGIFGKAGSGKTFSSLLIAEGIAATLGKRVAYWDTERGTDFYAKAVPARQFHPEAFDFDAIYTRSITDGLKDCRALDFNTHGVVVIDSMTHIWESTIAAYTGKKNAAGQIPMQAWSGIKKPYKLLMEWMMNSPFHVLILGREANEWAVDDNSGESVASGVKMKAEGETAYEPHILVRMEGVKQLRDDNNAKKGVKVNAEAIPTMFVLKDRTGVLQGMRIEYPNFQNFAEPLLPLLGLEQGKVQSEDEAAMIDSEAITNQKRQFEANSLKLAEEYECRFKLVEGKPDEIKAIAAELTPVRKKEMTAQHLDRVRAAWQAANGVKVEKPAESPAE